MAETKAASFGVWKKPSNNSKNRSYRGGKPKDSRVLFREREVKSESRHKERHNESHKKERRVHSHKRIEEEDSRRFGYRRSPSLRKFDSREGRVAAKVRRDSNDDVSDKRSKKHKCKHRRQHEDEKTVVEELVVSNNDDKIKKCRHTHRHRHHKKCKHRHHDEKQSSPSKSLPLEVRTNEHFSPLRMQKPSERVKSNSHLEVIPLDSKEIYAEGDKIYINVNFGKNAVNEIESDCNQEKVVSELSSDKINMVVPGVSCELSTSIISKPGEPPKKDVKLVSKSKTEFDIFWDDNSGHKNPKLNNENTTDTSVSNGIIFDNSSRKKSEHEFLPRSLLTDVKGLSLKTNPVIPETAFATTPPQTPPIAEDPKSMASSPDQTIPTPTQDESQVDSLKDTSNVSVSNSINSPVTPLSTTVTSPKTRVTEICDPEAPLENPVSEFDGKLVKNISKPENQRSVLSPSKGIFSPERQVYDLVKSKVSAKITPTKSQKSEKQNSFSSQVTSSTVSATSNALTNLMRLLPQSVTSSQTNAQSIVSMANKQSINQPKVNFEQKHLHQLLQTASSITSLLKNLPVANQTSAFPKPHHTRDVTEVVDMEVDSPHSPPVSTPISSSTNKSSASSMFLTSNPAMKPVIDQLMKAVQMKQTTNHKVSANHTELSSATFKRPISVSESLNKRCRSDINAVSLSSKSKHQNHGHHSSVKTKFNFPSDVGKRTNLGFSAPATAAVKLGDVAGSDDVPSSAVDLLVKEKYIKKLNRQERVVEEVKLVLKPYYQRREVTKEEYKEILRKSVPKICHSKTGEINPVKIKQLVEEYIKRMKHLRKKSKTKPLNTATSVAKL